MLLAAGNLQIISEDYIMKFKAALFDLDGTLLDTIDDLADSMNTILKKFGFPRHEVRRIQVFCG